MFLLCSVVREDKQKNRDGRSVVCDKNFIFNFIVIQIALFLVRSCCLFLFGKSRYIILIASFVVVFIIH